MRALLLISLLLATTASADLVALFKFDETAGTTASDTLDVHHATWVPGSDATPDWRTGQGVLGGASVNVDT